MRKLKVGDVVQITDPTHYWYPALVTVTEVKSWGIQGYAVIPTNDTDKNGAAYIRLLKDVYKYKYVGKAVVVSREE